MRPFHTPKIGACVFASKSLLLYLYGFICPLVPIPTLTPKAHSAFMTLKYGWQGTILNWAAIKAFSFFYLLQQHNSNLSSWRTSPDCALHWPNRPEILFQFSNNAVTIATQFYQVSQANTFNDFNLSKTLQHKVSPAYYILPAYYTSLASITLAWNTSKGLTLKYSSTTLPQYILQSYKPSRS